MISSIARPEIRWISSGFVLTLCSGFGQTYFIALFAGYLKSDLSLTDGQFGSLYSLATLASATVLMWAGQFADRVSIRVLGAWMLAGLALASLGMAYVSSGWILVFVLFGLRFFGQGMLTHLAMTAMGRWFTVKRGKAVAIAALGLPASEAVLPFLAVFVIAVIGWRMTWAVVAVALLVVSIPILLALLKSEPAVSASDIAEPATSQKTTPDRQRHQWTRGEVLKSPLFYALLPAVMAPPFILTGIFFNQVNIVNAKGWDLSWFAACFAILAGANVVSALVMGTAVDRYGARRLLPVSLVPLAAGIFVLAIFTSTYALPAFMFLAGITLGCISTIQGALWPELYGTRHLGGIRALATAGMVLSTAIAPAFLGVLLDAGVGIHIQLFGLSLYAAAAAFWIAALLPRLDRLALI